MPGNVFTKGLPQGWRDELFYSQGEANGRTEEMGGASITVGTSINSALTLIFQTFYYSPCGGVIL